MGDAPLSAHEEPEGAEVPSPAAAPEPAEPPQPTEAAEPARSADPPSPLEPRIAALETRADELVAVVRRQQGLIDELHAENQRLRAGEIREAVAPLVRGAARLLDDVERMRSPDRPDSDLDFLTSRVLELLGDAGVSVRRPEPGEPFDPRVHQAAGSSPTDDPVLDRTVAEVRRPGLTADDGRVLRPADVVVRRHVPAPPTADTTADTERAT